MSPGNQSFEERLQNAILGAYDLPQLDEMVRFRLRERLDVIAPVGDRLDRVVFAVIDWAVRAQRLADLAQAAAGYQQEKGAKVPALATLALELQPAPPPAPPAAGAHPLPGQLVQFMQSYEQMPQVIADGPARDAMAADLVAKMRGLTLEPYDLPGRLHLSESAGERLAVILALEQRPDPNYLRWLAERVIVESPFAGHAAALALTRAAVRLGRERFANVRAVAQEAGDRLRPEGADGAKRRAQLQEALAILEYRGGSMSRVPGLPFDEVAGALAGAFTATALKDLVQGQIGLNLALLVPLDRPVEYIVFHLLRTADAAEWDGKLILAARAAQPTCAPLAGVYARYAAAGALTP